MQCHLEYSGMQVMRDGKQRTKICEDKFQGIFTLLMDFFFVLPVYYLRELLVKDSRHARSTFFWSQ